MAERALPTIAARPREGEARTGRGWLVLGRLLVVLFGLILPFLLLEASLRLLGPWPPGGYDTGAYIERDEQLGHFHVRGYEGWMKAREFTTFIKISPLGLRDRRTTYEKPAGTFRILLIGDSFLEGVQVPQSEGVAERLEALLNQDGSRQIDVINAGVAAFGTAQELLLYENDLYQYQPDMVVLMFYVGNDVKNNSHLLEIPGGKKELALKPYFDLDRDGALVLIPGPPPKPQNPAIGVLRHCCWSYNMLEGNVFGMLGEAYHREDIEVVGGARVPFRDIYDTSLDSSWRRAWRITEALLARLQSGTQAQGAPLVLVGVPDWRALNNETFRHTILGDGRRDHGASPDAPTNRLGEIAERLGAPYVNLLPTFQTETERGTGPFYLPLDGHWNSDGHALAARALADALRSLGAGSR